jgi:hypothetical protein
MFCVILLSLTAYAADKECSSLPKNTKVRTCQVSFEGGGGIIKSTEQYFQEQRSCSNVIKHLQNGESKNCENEQEIPVICTLNNSEIKCTHPKQYDAWSDWGNVERLMNGCNKIIEKFGGIPSKGYSNIKLNDPKHKWEACTCYINELRKIYSLKEYKALQDKYLIPENDINDYFEKIGKFPMALIGTKVFEESDIKRQLPASTKCLGLNFQRIIEHKNHRPYTIHRDGTKEYLDYTITSEF